jgi:hypothetical protein
MIQLNSKTSSHRNTMDGLPPMGVDGAGHQPDLVNHCAASLTGILEKEEEEKEKEELMMSDKDGDHAASNRGEGHDSTDGKQEDGKGQVCPACQGTGYARDSIAEGDHVQCEVLSGDEMDIPRSQLKKDGGAKGSTSSKSFSGGRSGRRSAGGWRASDAEDGQAGSRANEHRASPRRSSGGGLGGNSARSKSRERESSFRSPEGAPKLGRASARNASSVATNGLIVNGLPFRLNDAVTKFPGVKPRNLDWLIKQIEAVYKGKAAHDDYRVKSNMSAQSMSDFIFLHVSATYGTGDLCVQNVAILCASVDHHAPSDPRVSIFRKFMTEAWGNKLLTVFMEATKLLAEPARYVCMHACMYR